MINVIAKSKVWIRGMEEKKKDRFSLILPLVLCTEYQFTFFVLLFSFV